MAKRRTFVTAGYLRVITGAFFGFVTLVEIPSVLDPGKGGLGGRIFAGLIAVAGAVLTVRSVRSATLVASDGGVTYRSLIRTRYWPWDRIAGFEALAASVGIMAWQRCVLYLRDSDGHLHKCEELNARLSRSPNPVEEVAGVLNDLAAEHGEGIDHQSS